jgi:hypothetical protein
MKYSPTVTLALALAAGIAGAAAAQTTATPGAASNSPQPAAPTMSAAPNYGQPQATVTQPQATYGQSRPNSAQGQPNLTQPQPTYTQTTPSAPAGAGVPAQAGQANIQSSTTDQVKSAQEQLQAAGLYNGRSTAEWTPTPGRQSRASSSRTGCGEPRRSTGRPSIG